MSMKQNLIKEFKDAKYLEMLYKLKAQHTTLTHQVEYYCACAFREEAISEALERCFSVTDKRNLIPKLAAECENVAKTHFFIYDMANESEG